MKPQPNCSALLVIMAVCFWICAAFATNSINGTVVKHDGGPLVGANVFIAGTQTGSTTEW